MSKKDKDIESIYKVFDIDLTWFNITYGIWAKYWDSYFKLFTKK